MGGLTQTKVWPQLQAHQNQMKDSHIRELFDADTERLDWFSMSTGHWYFDYSKNLIGREGLQLLIDLARERGLESMRDDMFAGKRINNTENRAVLHVALRNPANSHITLEGEDIMPSVRHTRARMGAFVEAIHSGSWTSATGKKIKNIVNIGIGGSELGPRMAVEALSAYHISDLTIRFDSNVDSANFYEAVMSDLDPEETLFIIASKTFTTDETMTNALTARLWIEQAMGVNALDSHFVAVTAHTDKATAFGIADTNIFRFWDWIGGRYALPSAVGLSVMLAIGSARFDKFLAGYHTMDEHFRTSPLEENMPVIMGLLSVWYTNFFDSRTELLAPYSQFLQFFPSFVQQLSMESNGKMVTREGEMIHYNTAPIVWGQPGTNSQHSYFQLLHQGTHLIPTDFIGFAESDHPQGEHHKKLLANMIAQSEALAFGKSTQQLKEEGVAEDLLIHKAVPGNRPSNTLFAQKLTPEALGELIALYEHKTFTQGVIWGVNSFDQWGVELGKTLAGGVYKELRSRKTSGEYNPSTAELIKRARKP